jgi:hypothetical protein
MDRKSQTKPRLALVLLLILCVVPSFYEGVAVAWGQMHGMAGKALRDGLDFWAGGFLGAHGQVPVLFDTTAYNGFLRGLYGVKLPFHMWSYPPNYLLLAGMFGFLAPWHAVLAFDVGSLLLLVWVLRLSGQGWGLIAAVALSPVSFENFLEGQNAALLTALIGGGLLVLPRWPRLGGVLVGLASIKPQLGLALPLFLWWRSRAAFAYAALAAVMLAAVSLAVFGAQTWRLFFTVTEPAMSGVLLTGRPPEFAGGLISVFAAVRFLGVYAALLIQGVVTMVTIIVAARTRNPAVVLILTALASPYLHDYDLLGVALAVALMAQSGLKHGFAPGEAVLLFLAWFGPGMLPWQPQFAHLTPVVLVLLLASASRYGRLNPCDSSPAKPGSPVLLAGRLPIHDRPGSTAPGWTGTE